MTFLQKVLRNISLADLSGGFLLSSYEMIVYGWYMQLDAIWHCTGVCHYAFQYNFFLSFVFVHSLFFLFLFIFELKKKKMVSVNQTES